PADELAVAVGDIGPDCLDEATQLGGPDVTERERPEQIARVAEGRQIGTHGRRLAAVRFDDLEVLVGPLGEALITRLREVDTTFVDLHLKLAQRALSYLPVTYTGTLHGLSVCAAVEGVVARA